MASSFALRRITSSNLLPRSLPPFRSAAFYRYFNSTDGSFDLDSRSDGPLLRRREFSPFPDVISSFSSSDLSRIVNMNLTGSPVGLGNLSKWSSRGGERGLYYQKVMPGLAKGDIKVSLGQKSFVSKVESQMSSRKEESTRTFSTGIDLPEKSDRKKTLRPLSPHLSIYQPQLSSTTSIFNRIAGSYLTAASLSFYLYLKVGSLCFTYDNFYQFSYYSAKVVPIAVEISALALAYHTFAGIRHLVADFSGKIPLSPKRVH